MLDQLSQEQILKETCQFIITLFEEQLSQEINFREASTFEEVISKVTQRNFDKDKEEQFTIAGLSLFLFIKLSKLYSENMNYYQLMERLLAMLLQKVPLMYIEFLIFLEIIRDEDRVGDLKILQGIFQGMYFDKMCDLLNRCCSHIDIYPDLLQNTMKYCYISLTSSLLVKMLRLMLQVVVKHKPEAFRQILCFIVRIFNSRIGLELEINETFKYLAGAYRQQFKILLLEVARASVGLQNGFWAVHKIITQEEEETSLELVSLAFKEAVNGIQDLKRKKKDLFPFLWGFRQFFETKFLTLTDEKVMVNSLCNMASLKADISDFVYLIFKPLNDKIIQKSLRIYLKNVDQEQDAIFNLCEHLVFWKEQNFTKTGSDPEKFSLDFLILKQLDTYFEEHELDKTIIQQLN